MPVALRPRLLEGPGLLPSARPTRKGKEGMNQATIRRGPLSRWAAIAWAFLGLITVGGAEGQLGSEIAAAQRSLVAEPSGWQPGGQQPGLARSSPAERERAAMVLASPPGGARPRAPAPRVPAREQEWSSRPPPTALPRHQRLRRDRGDEERRRDRHRWRPLRQRARLSGGPGTTRPGSRWSTRWPASSCSSRSVT
jgi:hypothetical protein